MDLVDIDQVLDNLELSVAADERAKAVTVTAESVKTPPPEARVLGDGATSRNFVGVSQVFNSLDDYRNNVQSLNSAAQHTYDWQQKESDESDEAGGDSINVANTVGAGEVASSVECQNSINGDENNDDVNDEATGTDIHDGTEFNNDVPKTDSTGGDGSEPSGTASDSLTTSSCSTFSSGPSPGSIQNTDEDNDEVEEESGKQSAVQMVPKVPNELESTSTEMGLAAVGAEPSLSQSDCVKDSKNAALEELATGLSSISITTESRSILPCEVTASSALGRVLNELSATGLEVTESEVSVLPAEPDVKRIQDAELLQRNDDANPNMPKQIKPLTFCSTMDDISDTELDSMLQEMDIDDVAEQQSQEPQLPHQQEGIKVSQNLQDNNKHNADEDIKDADNPSEPETTSHSMDHMNADNFSQASTVEFAEIKTDAATQQMISRAAEEITSSYTSTDSDSLSDQRIENDEEANKDNDDEAKQRPERPNTLDLMSCNAPLSSNTGETLPGGESANAPEEQAEANMSNNEYYNLEQALVNEEDSESISEAVGFSDPHANLGKVPPIWVPDNMAVGCMQCQQKFTMIKRRHHCRACGKVLCSICCSQRIKLEFLPEPESRVCVQCFLILTQRQEAQQAVPGMASEVEANVLPPTPMRSPNPNNPMEYCSTIPPHRQVSSTSGAPPPSVIVPVGVLKKEGSYSSTSSNSSGQKTRKRKSVMFSDGIAPGSELASSIEQQWAEAKHARRAQQQHGDKNRATTNNKPPTPASNETRSIDSATMGLVAQLFRGSIAPSAAAATINVAQRASEQQTANVAKTRTNSSPRRKVDSQRSKKLPALSDPQGCLIPYEDCALPPICVPSSEHTNCDYDYKEIKNDFELVERLQKETLKFIVRNNFYVYVKIVNLNCCMNRTVINFTTFGMHHVGNDEIIVLLEYDPPAKREELLEPAIPKDIFMHLHEIYCDAENGRPISELAYSSPKSSSFLGSHDYGGFIYIRATYQCLQEVIMPENPYLVAVLIHRHEIPWAKIFPLRLMLRLGAQYRYYPCPLISIRNRESVYAEIAQTIINFLADFRNYSYTLPTIRGMYIHMEDRQTTVMIPRNRQDDVNKAINNASDHILAFSGNFSKSADGHLVCMQNVNDDRTELFAYSTQAINIQGQPRKITGASFFVLNEALKTTSGLSGKCSIVEDGLMVQILPAKMEEVRNALRNQTDVKIVCGPVDATDQQTEIVSIKWVDNDRDFNINVKSPIDDKSMEGISSMRVHASFNYSNDNYLIRLTDIFILKFDDWYNATQATLGSSSSDITRISEQVARSASMALIPFLDLLAAAGITKIGLRATLHQENVCYEAGARGSKLPPLYMKALDNHLIPTLHNESSGIVEAIILELIFYILNV